MPKLKKKKQNQKPSVPLSQFSTGTSVFKYFGSDVDFSMVSYKEVSQNTITL